MSEKKKPPASPGRMQPYGSGAVPARQEKKPPMTPAWIESWKRIGK